MLMLQVRRGRGRGGDAVGVSERRRETARPGGTASGRAGHGREEGGGGQGGGRPEEGTRQPEPSVKGPDGT